MLAALLLAVLVIPWRPPTLCLLRGLTGVPCPFCGGTTAFVQLGRGDLVGALRTSPLAVLGAPVWAAWPRLGPLLRLGPRTRWSLLGVALTGSQVWQVSRLMS